MARIEREGVSEDIFFGLPIGDEVPEIEYEAIPLEEMGGFKEAFDGADRGQRSFLEDRGVGVAVFTSYTKGAIWEFVKDENGEIMTDKDGNLVRKKVGHRWRNRPTRVILVEHNNRTRLYDPERDPPWPRFESDFAREVLGDEFGDDAAEILIELIEEEIRLIEERARR